MEEFEDNKDAACGLVSRRAICDEGESLISSMTSWWILLDHSYKVEYGGDGPEPGCESPSSKFLYACL